jgi:transcriptional repressor NrdR
MQCLRCGSLDSKVIYTRHHENENATVRRRECLDCKGRYTTKEHMDVKKYVGDIKGCTQAV